MSDSTALLKRQTPLKESYCQNKCLGLHTNAGHPEDPSEATASIVANAHTFPAEFNREITRLPNNKAKALLIKLIGKVVELFESHSNNADLQEIFPDYPALKKVLKANR